jgi:KDO2-lipid IV(A) lauroyltransferase
MAISQPDQQRIKQYIKGLRPTLAGWLLYYLMPIRRRVIRSNMRIVFADVLSKKETAKLIKCFYSHVMRSLRENVSMRFMTRSQIEAKARVVGHEKVITAAEKSGRGVIIITGHFGNWEFSPIAGMAKFQDFKDRLHFIRKTIKPQFLERLMFRRYYRVGLQVIPKKHSLHRVCDVLDQNHAVIFVMDQHASPPKDGMMVDFFGKPAGTFRSPATLARYQHIPVIPAFTYRDVDNTHVLEFLDAIAWESFADNKVEHYQNTLKYNRALEKMVLLKPEQWFWMHRRWKAP